MLALSGSGHHKISSYVRVEMKCCDCCVPSEGICLCFFPSQDSRRERSNNFQAFVKMALETLLGSCRRKHGGPRGRQGWVHLPSALPSGAYRLCAVVWPCNTASAHISQRPKVNLISIHHHLLFNLRSFSPPSKPSSVPFPALSAPN